MPPIRKVQLDKAAWLWCETVDPDKISEDNVDTAYRGNVPKCKLGTCRRNCRGNPYCLSGLGESRWLSDNVDESEDEDVDLQIRQPETFVGLKNLGATCYVNSLVQLWFHNLAFRKAIYSWNPLEDPMESAEMPDEDISVKSPRTVVGHLQLLFALMQFSKQKSIDPLAFIKALDLEPSMQQDAQEFSKLFISLLEESLNQQSDPKVQNLITDNFRGEYSYITRCSKCQKESISPSMFFELELNIKGNKTLHESISEFLKEENLDGVNKYSCSFCNEMQEATRFISLKKLPVVLNLQLMRFIYDRQKGHKKKINSSLQFPDTLDMSQYMTVPENENKPIMYNLTAVLIHKGPSAYSGHYVAHICDQLSGTWYKFNDEQVEKMEGNKLKLGSEEEDENGAKKPKQARVAKGFLASSNAYMLVYTAQSVREGLIPVTENDLQPQLLKQIQQSNDEFEKLILETKEEKKNRKEIGQAQKATMANLVKIMTVDGPGTRDWEAISVKWLSLWLTNSKEDFEPVDNSPLLCSHNRLNPDLVSNAKYITTAAADSIFGKYGGGPRLPASEALCRDCITAKCRRIKFRIKLTEDAKELSNLLKHKEELDGNGFWVGKKSLKDWRKKALTVFEETEGGVMREVEDCPSPSSDSDAVPCQNKTSCSEFESVSINSSCDKTGNGTKPHSKKLKVTDSFTTPDQRVVAKLEVESIFESLENLLSGTRETLSKLDDLTPELISEFKQKFYASWKNLDLMFNKICDYNSTCSPISESTSLVTSTSEAMDISTCEPSRVNGICHSVEEESAPRKRKFEQVNDKDGVNSSDENKVSKSDDEEDDAENFNEDIICQHNNLIPEETLKRLVSESTWAKLKSYFPDCREFSKDVDPCPQCQRLASQDQATLDIRRDQALKQKEMLPSLLNNRNRPKLVSGTYKIVSVQEFLKPWRRFVRENGRSPPLYSLRNNTLVCVHGLLMYDPASEEDATMFTAVTDEEWNALVGSFYVDLEISVTYGASEFEIIETSPALCKECVSARLASEQEALLQYEKARIYIRPISNKKDEVSDSSETSSSAQLAKKSPGPSKLMGGGDAASSEAAIRRSTRHRRVRGERELQVSSTDTVRDLKLKILNSLRVAPFDQHLSTEDGRHLEDPTATLGSLNIYPDSVLILKVDEPPDDTSMPVDDYIRTSEPEEGFKGTVLLKR
nr:ubiquitin carboxyl-terminal hydrolase 48-like isoform X2 [Halyomorpha halys]